MPSNCPGRIARRPVGDKPDPAETNGNSLSEHNTLIENAAYDKIEGALEAFVLEVCA